MIAVNSFYAFQDATAAGESISGNIQGDLLTVEVSGTATGVSLTVQGLVDYKNENYTQLSGINLTGLTLVNTVTEKGIYQFSIDGIIKFKVKLASVTGGKATVYCRVTKGV